MNFSDRLRAARAHAGLSQRVLAERVGISQPGYQKLERGASGSKFVTQIAYACGVNPEWLATGKGEMLPATRIVDTVSLGPDIRSWHPLIGSIPCGSPTLITEKARQSPDTVWLPSPKAVPASCFYLRVSGNSMSPTVRDGDLVLINPERTPQHRDIVAVRNGDNESTLKRLIVDGGDFLLVPDNPQYPTKALDGYDIIGVAIHSYREL
ncbi:XRE family transcriptional regulator [Acidithiobacillus sp. YTS05]|nr:XRE family transcriptional regulator [Acidithiobacillus sp. YTS05]